MANQLISNAEALRLFFNDDIYLVKNETVQLDPAPSNLQMAATPTHSASVELPAPATKAQLSAQAQAPTKIEVKFIGKNQKNILILVNDATHKVSTESGAELLRNIVRAMGLQGDDFALVNYAHYLNVSYQQLHDFFNCKLVLAFGISASQLGLNEMALHQLFTYNATTQMVFTHNLAELAADGATKKVLWNSLQQLNNG